MPHQLVTLLVAVCMLGTVAVSAQEERPLRIAVEGAYPPFSYVDQEGTLRGFDIDIANALCDAMQAQCTLVPQDWDALIPGLLTRKYDAILASMSITEERRKRVDFTNKYYQTPARFVVAKDREVDLTPEGLAGLNVGVQRATIHDSFLSENFGNEINIVRYGTLDEVYLDMVAGRLDLFMADSVAANEGFLKSESGAEFHFVGPNYSDPKWFGEGAGIALRKNEDELREAFNMAIAELRQNGTYDALSARYFDFDIYGD